jgi:hypothetical protein
MEMSTRTNKKYGNEEKERRNKVKKEQNREVN